MIKYRISLKRAIDFDAVVLALFRYTINDENQYDVKTHFLSAEGEWEEIQKNQFFGEDELPRMDVRELEIDRNIRKQEEWKDKEEAHREKNDG